MDARRLAWKLSLREDEYPTRLFGRAADEAGLSPQDKAFARELLGGVLRRRRSLDAVIAAYAKGRVTDPRLRAALRLGLYQLLFLRGVPPHAALHGTLEAVKPECTPRIGFLNGLLRAVQRGVKREEPPVDGRARDRMPAGAWSLRFDRAVLADPQTRLAGWLADAWSQPESLTHRWLQASDEETTLARVQAFDRPAPLGLRVNPLRASRESVLEALARAGVSAAAGEHPQHLRVTEPAGGVAALPGFHEGHWSVQDASALDAIALAAPQPGERVLDLCAAPGGKSFAVYEACGGDVEVLACDTHPARLERMEAERARLGHDSVRTMRVDAEQPAPEGPWNLVICDVPCSNTGVLHKRPEARWRFSAQTLREAVAGQDLLRKRQLLPVLGPATRVLWTTCSLEPEENEQAVERLARHSGLSIADARLFEPDATRSGGFAALLVPEA